MFLQVGSYPDFSVKDDQYTIYIKHTMRLLKLSQIKVGRLSYTQVHVLFQIGG